MTMTMMYHVEKLHEKIDPQIGHNKSVALQNLIHQQVISLQKLTNIFGKSLLIIVVCSRKYSERK